MGANTFSVTAKGKTAKDAFTAAVEQAQYDYGHRGYTGSIAEKHAFVSIPLPAGKDAAAYADELLNAGDPRVDDKWGPAGCIACGKDQYIFFGWASS